MTSKPLLVYWDIRVFAEPIRLLLHYLQVDFEDKRIAWGESSNLFEHWKNQRDQYGLDFPNLPLYIDEDVKLTQSTAIVAYIGRKHNLAGDNIKDQAVLDMMCHLVNDIRIQAWLVYQAESFHQIKDEWKTTIPSRWAEVNKFLEGKKFILGEKISYADFILYEGVEWFRTFAGDVFENHEGLRNIEQFQRRIQALPTVKAYLESDKFKPMPMFGPPVHFGHSEDPDYKPPPFSFRNYTAKYEIEKKTSEGFWKC